MTDQQQPLEQDNKPAIHLGEQVIILRSTKARAMAPNHPNESKDVGGMASPTSWSEWSDILC